jgi:hypothetical protein
VHPATAAYEVLQALAILYTGDQCLQDVPQPAIKELEQNFNTHADHLRNYLQPLLKQSLTPLFLISPPN